MVVNADPTFITQHISVNSNGTYTVTLYDTNSGAPITYTTGIPATQAPYPPNRQLTLADQRIGSSGQKIFWPSLYEQAVIAYAASHPGADQTQDNSLDTGHVTVGYQLITGAAYNWADYDGSNSDNFWTNLSYANAGIPVAALTRTPTSGDTFADGIIGGHFYVVLKTETSADNQRYVTLRNPWGPRAYNVSDAQDLGDGEIRIAYTLLLQYFYEFERAADVTHPP